MDEDYTIDVDFEDDDELSLELDVVIKEAEGSIANIGLAGANSLAGEAGKQVPTSLTQRILDQAQKKAGSLVTEINQTTKDRINQAISKGLDKGWSVDQMKNYLLHPDDGTRPIINDEYRAELISRTESVGAYSRGRDDSANEWGATGKIWETQSGNPCPDCQECEDDGEIPFDDSFGPGWDTPDDSHPGCFCIVTYTFPSGEEE
jgi:uncharacterized protein with gpF-like domain